MRQIKVKTFMDIDGKLQPIISINDACGILRCSRRTIYNDVNNGVAPELLKHGKQSYFCLAEFEAWRATRRMKKCK